MRTYLRSFLPCLGFALAIGLQPALVSQDPVFISTPCGAVQFATVGVPISIPVSAAAATGQQGETVVLASGALPNGSTMTPSLPAQVTGSPAVVTSTFDWTPTTADVGFVAIGFVAINQLSLSAQCSIVFDVVALPTFDPPTPCGQVLTATVGVPITFNVQASCLGNFVSLIDGGIPAGASHNPPLPLTNAGPNPSVSTTFTWTPTNAQIGQHFINYLAFNKQGLPSFCTVQIGVAECFLFLGLQSGNHQIGPSSMDRLLVDPFIALPISMTSSPSIPILNHPMFHGMHIYVQVGMNNPNVFPNDPVQMSPGLDVILGVGVNQYAHGGSGVFLFPTTSPVLGGTLSFGIYIPGL